MCETGSNTPWRWLRRGWERWKSVAKKIGDVQARAILVLFYFLILGPFALVVRLATDPLATKPGTPRGWRPRDGQDAVSLSAATRQS